jgi:hypothetical protein
MAEIHASHNGKWACKGGKAVCGKKTAFVSPNKEEVTCPYCNGKPIELDAHVLEMVEGELLNNETSTDSELVEYFIANGLDRKASVYFIKQRTRAGMEGINFQLDLSGK